MNRTQVLREPGLIEFNGVKFHAKQAVSIDQIDDLFDVTAINFGKIEDRPQDRRFEIKLIPVGQWDSLSVLFPYFSTVIGADIYGSSDLPLTVWTRSGKKYVFANAAITSVPQINPKVGDTLLGEITFTALLAKDAEPGDSGAYYTLTTGQAYPGDSTFDKDAILTKHPTLVWNDTIDTENPTPWDSFKTVDGVQIMHNLTLAPVKVNGLGTIGMRLADLQLTAQFQPAGNFTAADLLTATGGNLALGSSPLVNALVISYSGFYVALTAVALRNSKFKFGTAEGDNLIQGIEARATRTFDTGAAVPLGYVGTAAP